MSIWTECPHATDGHTIELVGLVDPFDPRRCPKCAEWYVIDARPRAAEIKIRAERKAGELLSGLNKHRGAPGMTRQAVGSSDWPTDRDGNPISPEGLK